MSIIGLVGKLFGLGATETVASAADVVLDSAERVKTLITGQLPPDKQVEVELEFTRLQSAINQNEAQHASLFVAGWRPGAGWLGVIGLAYATIIQPILVWVSVNIGILSPPQLDTEVLTTILYAMLGLGLYRTLEKSGKVHNKK